MMEHDAAKTEICLACGALTAAPATFCAQCGKPLDPAHPPALPASRWHQNIWLVLLLLFFVVGPFGLPLVWNNPRLSRPVKTVLTGVMVVYTVVLVQMIIRIYQSVTQELTNIDSALRF